MQRWARDNQVEIESRLFFVNKTVDDIISLNFNPSGDIARLSSAEQGLTILCCAPHPGEETEALCLREHAEDLTAANGTLAKQLLIGRSGSLCNPAKN